MMTFRIYTSVFVLFISLGCTGQSSTPTQPSQSQINETNERSVNPKAPERFVSQETDARSNDSSFSQKNEEQQPSLDLSGIVSKWAKASYTMGNVKFMACKNRLCVKDGSLAITLGVVATDVHGVKLTESGFKVRYSCNYCCTEDGNKLILSRDEIGARFENTLALKQHHSKNYDAAAAGFAAALKRDPKLKVARTNLACALAQRGNVDEAAVVLLDGNRALSMENYLNILSDPDLRPLRIHPRTKEIIAKVPGDVPLEMVDRELADFGIAYSPEKKMFAIISTYQSWGADMHSDDLDIFDAVTGKRLLRVFLGSFDFENEPQDKKQMERDRREKQKRFKVVARFLADLGFAVVPSSKLSVGIKFADRDAMRFKEEKMTLVSRRNHFVLKLVENQRRKFSVDGEIGYLQDAAYIPYLKTFIVETHVDEPEGCRYEGDINYSVVLPLENSVSM